MNFLEVKLRAEWLLFEEARRMELLKKEFLHDVPLPDDLTQQEIFDALKNTQKVFKKLRKDSNIVLSEIIQANNFRGIVSNVFTSELDKISDYKKFSDQAYPDLKHEKKGIGLEVKAANKAFKGGEGHNGHSGWHIVVCYRILDNGDIEFIHVQIANLKGIKEGLQSDWKYVPSKLKENGSQRTETYTTTDVGTAKLRDGTVYLNTDIIKITKQRKRNRYNIKELPVPNYSPFFWYFQ